jgi:hypothetical protein
MVRIKKWKSDCTTPNYSVRCDSKGRSGYWSCENLAPAADHRGNAANVAKLAGWIVTDYKWYCPECQRDGFVPHRAAVPRDPHQAQQFTD